MNRSSCIVAVLFVLMLAGCASDRALIQPIMPATQAPAMESAYLAGMFSRKWDSSQSSFGLGLINIRTAEEYVIPFGRETTLPTNISDEFDMIQVPPGEYRIAYWIRYSIKEQAPLSRTPYPPESLTARAFTLGPGEVVFLGSFVPDAVGRTADGDNLWEIRHWRLNQRSVQRALERNYPGFKAQPWICPSCLE